MVLVKMSMKIGPPMKEEALVMTMASISPSRREVSHAESLCGYQKGLCIGFCLDTVVLRTKSILLIFSRSKAII